MFAKVEYIIYASVYITLTHMHTQYSTHCDMEVEVRQWCININLQNMKFCKP